MFSGKVYSGFLLMCFACWLAVFNWRVSEMQRPNHFEALDNVTCDFNESLSHAISSFVPTARIQVKPVFVNDSEGYAVEYGDGLRPANQSMSSGSLGMADVFSSRPVSDNHISRITLQSNIYTDLRDHGVPHRVVAQVIDAFRHLINFQSGIKFGDVLTVFYNDVGVLKYAELTTAYKTFKVYNHRNGPSNCFCDESGAEIGASALKMPISGARISSSFGTRLHPILGLVKKHKGVDFAAPIGTPISASGDGRVVQIGNLGAYGKCVTIRHNDGIKTRYGHMSRFNPNLAVGSRVKQGEVIGFVGRTGRATGAHLHFELIAGGTHVNPMKMKLVSKSTPRAARPGFRAFKAAIDRELSVRATEQQPAQNQI